MTTTPTRPAEPNVDTTPTYFGDFLASIGRPFLASAGTLSRSFTLLSRTLYAVARRPKSRTAVTTQLYEVGNRSLAFIAITLTVWGVISIYQIGTQMERILPDFTIMGASFLKVIIRQLGPLITAVMLAARVGTGIAAELGSMVVTEQIDALKMNNRDPVEYLVVPRFIACFVMQFALTVFGVVVAIVAGMATAWVGFEVHPQTFLNTQLLNHGDLIIALCKCASYGVAIPILSAQAGLETRGGSEGVGWATTRAVVNSSVAIVILDFLWSALRFTLFPPSL